MQNVKSFALFAACIFLFLTCKKDDSIIEGSANWPGKTVTATFVGQVLDDAGQPLENAKIRVGVGAAKTDANGIFLLRDQKVNSARAVVSVSKTGFFDGFRTLFVQKNSQNRLVFRLLKKETTASFAASASGKVELSGGATVEFLPNSISKNGQPFSEKVNVAAHWLDPEDQSLVSKMPGALRGLRADGAEKGLRTFGMIVVELTDEAGEKLELLSGQKAKITMPIPASLVADAPATLPLWHFSEGEGIWGEEGSATKIGSNFVAEVGHFSWWNCDVPFEGVSLKIRLKRPDGTPFSNVALILKSQNFGRGITFSDQDGLAEGLVPIDEAFEMKVLASLENSCFYTVLLEKSIGPFSENTDLGDTEIDPDNASSGSFETTEIKGRLMICDGQPVQNGYVKVQDIAEHFAFTDSDGRFVYDDYCTPADWPSSISARGFDPVNAGQSALLYQNYSKNVDFGDISVCFFADEYVTYQIDGGAPQTYPVKKDSLILGDQIFINGSGDWGGKTVFTLGWKHDNQAADNLKIQFMMEGGYIMTLQDETLSAMTDMKKFPKNKGEYLEGTFSGTFDKFSQPKTITGEYRAKRVF